MADVRAGLNELKRGESQSQDADDSGSRYAGARSRSCRVVVTLRAHVRTAANAEKAEPNVAMTSMRMTGRGG